MLVVTDFMDRDPLIEALEIMSQDLRPEKPAPAVEQHEDGALVMDTPRMRLIYRPVANVLAIYPRGQVGLQLAGEAVDELMTFCRKVRYW